MPAFTHPGEHTQLSAPAWWDQRGAELQPLQWSSRRIILDSRFQRLLVEDGDECFTAAWTDFEVPSHHPHGSTFIRLTREDLGFAFGVGLDLDRRADGQPGPSGHLPEVVSRYGRYLVINGPHRPGDGKSSISVLVTPTIQRWFELLLHPARPG